MCRKNLLSVIIPIYNGQKYLKRMMIMLDQQTFHDFQVIFVDDGSEDDTYRICKEFQSQRDNITVIRQENKGVSYARNAGIEAAKGEWIQFIDVDDILHADLFERFSRRLSEDCRNHASEKTSGAELAVCGCIRRTGEDGEAVYCGPEKSGFLNKNDIIDVFTNMNMESRYWMLDYIWNKWFRRDIIEQFQIRFPEDLSLGEDFVFNTHYYRYIRSMTMISDPCYEYEVHADGLTGCFQRRPWKDRAELYASHKRLLQIFGIWDLTRSEVRRQYGQIYFGDMRGINSLKCKYDASQKLSYIRKMMSDELFYMILDYLSAQEKPAYIIYRIVLKSRSVRLIYFLIRAEWLIKRFLSPVVFFNLQKGRNNWFERRWDCKIQQKKL